MAIASSHRSTPQRAKSPASSIPNAASPQQRSIRPTQSRRRNRYKSIRLLRYDSWSPLTVSNATPERPWAWIQRLRKTSLPDASRYRRASSGSQPVLPITPHEALTLRSAAETVVFELDTKGVEPLVGSRRRAGAKTYDDECEGRQCESPHRGPPPEGSNSGNVECRREYATDEHGAHSPGGRRSAPKKRSDNARRHD